MLTYLDSANFAWLERSSAEEQERFRSAWLASGAQLALSLHHLQEMAQLRDSSSLRRRLHVLELFPAIHCLPASSSSVLAWEIRVQLLEMVGQPLPMPDMAGRRQFFPLADRRRLMVDTAASREVFAMARSAMETSARAETLSKGASSPKEQFAAL